MRRPSLPVAFVALVTLAAGCGSKTSPTETEDFGNLSGDWLASVSTSCGASGTVAARVIQTGATVEIAVPGVGSALGFLDGGVVVGSLTLAGCSGSATGALVVYPNLLSGSFSGALSGNPPGCCGSQPIAVRLTR